MGANVNVDDWNVHVEQELQSFLDKMARAGNPGATVFRLYDDRAGKPLRSALRGWSFFLGGLGGEGVVAEDGRLYVRRDWVKTHWFRAGTSMPGAAQTDAEALFRYSESSHGKSGRWPVTEIRETLARLARDQGVGTD